MKKVLALVLTLAMLMSLAFVSTASAAEITDLRTYELTSREMETWNIHSSQLANDLNVLCNLIDGLLTNDSPWRTGGQRRQGLVHRGWRQDLDFRAQ